MSDKGRKIASIILIILGGVLTIIGLFTLPEDVVTQFGTNGERNTMSRIPALLIPLVITTVFSTLLLRDEGNEESKKHLFGALLGILLFLILFGVNL